MGHSSGQGSDALTNKETKLERMDMGVACAVHVQNVGLHEVR